ncbi:topoisomerase C-terminal repeat-containing protein [Dolosigranulum pigrum]|nr:topoisomerase C-terminal repeat-containing protein [Dolosigranulum pigrum]
MSKSDMRDLLMKGKTSKKKKMKSKKGNEFKAYWVLKNQRVEFEF